MTTSQSLTRRFPQLERKTDKSLERQEKPFSLLLKEMNFGLLLPKKLMLKLIEVMLLLKVDLVVQL